MNSRDNIRAKKATVRLSQWVLAYLKEEHGIPLTQIGATIEIGETFLSKVLNGKEAFSMKRLLQLARAFHIPLPLLIMEAVKHGCPELWSEYASTQVGHSAVQALRIRAAVHEEQKYVDAERALVLHELREAIAVAGERQDRNLINHMIEVCEEAESSDESLGELLTILWSELRSEIAPGGCHVGSSKSSRPAVHFQDSESQYLAWTMSGSDPLELQGAGMADDMREVSEQVVEPSLRRLLTHLSRLCERASVSRVATAELLSLLWKNNPRRKRSSAGEDGPDSNSGCQETSTVRWCSCLAQ